jgi:transcriptional regulator with XRE-family HTH domain
MNQINDKDPLDKYIGGVIKEIRLSKNITQEALGQMVGVTFQQIQKYESGRNRISASSLFKISFALETDMNIFFPKSNYDQDSESSNNEKISDLDYNFERTETVVDKETTQVIKLFKLIDDEIVKKRIVALLKSLV